MSTNLDNINVARKAGTMGKEENKEMEFWTQDEFQTFLECVADKPISYYAFEMLYWTGIREGELLALTPADLILKRKHSGLTSHIRGWKAKM